MTLIHRYMQRMLCVVLLAVLCLCGASAVPAKRACIKHRQPDGTIVGITVRGDENFHFECTLDGVPVVLRQDGVYCYARRSADGLTLAPTVQMAHDAASRPVAEKAFVETEKAEFDAVRALGQTRAAARNAARMARLASSGITVAQSGMMRQKVAGAAGSVGTGVTGRRKGLVILVNFQDVKMQAECDNAEWTDFFNMVGYSRHGNAGSVHDYFSEQSYGLLDLSFDVVGPVTVSRNMSYYGGNDSRGNDRNPFEMVYEACLLADSQVNFADYDWDGDGEADQVFIVYAGYGEASNPRKLADTIWPHESRLADAKYNLTLDGVKINTYGCTCELYGAEGTRMEGIGTACHEFSHCMGLPDIYDTSGSGCYGMDEWDLMDYGSYGGDGYCPVGYNTYERWVSGWMQPTVLDRGCTVDGMKALSVSPESYIACNDRVPTEYYIFENRQQTGFDTSLPAHGMLVIHVDYDQTAWQENSINNVFWHQRFTIVPADGDLSGVAGTGGGTNGGDTYPGTTGNTSLTDYSSPAASLFNANADGRYFLGKPVTDIAETSDGLVSFCFMGGKELDMPCGMTTTLQGNTAFMASWSDVSGADCYNLQLRKAPSTLAADHVLAAEDFRQWGAALTADSNSDISSVLDSHMACKGWTGSKVYVGPGRLKIGSSKADGHLVSPVASGMESDVVTVRMASGVYNSDKAELIVTLFDLQGNKIDAVKVVPDGSTCLLHLENPERKDCRLTVQPAKRCYLYSIGIYDGYFDEAGFGDSDVHAGDSVGHDTLQSGMAARDAAGVLSVNSLVGTTYAFSGLDAGTAYQWRVQAVAGSVVSKWSAWQDAVLAGGSTGVSGLGECGSIAGGDMVTVYSSVGVLLGDMTYAAFLAAKMHDGIYIIRCGGKAHKCVKR